MVVAEQPAKPLPPSYAALPSIRVGRQLFNELVPKPLMIPLPVVVLDVLRRRWCSPRGIMRANHSDLIDRTKRSAKAFRFGLRAGSRSAFTPALARMLRKDRREQRVAGQFISPSLCAQL
jgi:hypothetical protein